MLPPQAQQIGVASARLCFRSVMVRLNKGLVATNVEILPHSSAFSTATVMLEFCRSGNLFASLVCSLTKSVVERPFAFKAGANLTIAMPETRTSPIDRSTKYLTDM